MTCKKKQPSCEYSRKDWPEKQQRQNQSNENQRKTEEPITLRCANTEEVPDFVYIGSQITTDGDSMAA